SVHLQRFTAAFNLGVFENDLKIKAWSLPERRAEVAAAMDVLSHRGVALKGHVLIWPGFRYLTPDFERFQKNPKLVSRMMKDHLESVLTATYGKISRWDVVNEAYTNTDLQRITGSEDILYQGFRMLKKREPGVLRYVNEYGIISRGGIDTQKQQWYYDFVRRIDAATGGLVDGVGIQSHIGSDLTPPEKVLQILDFYAPLGKKISISEFTMDIDDPEVRTRYTRDFITAAFSHPSVYEFLFWGYKTEKADIYDAQWRHGTMGKAFFDLVHGEWKTKLLLATDDKGMVSGRGFWGKYEYTVMLDGKLYKGEFDLLPGQGNVLKIKL
ncbi:MAG TPA: endo-1,4-beta-xylanase, partial [Saprospiraceae bacterium]|nr:endo-1,4-beta-xylanase [Saprospiraceae bacterium]